MAALAPARVWLGVMHIWVDADACPNAIREILVRAAERTHIPMTLVAGQPVQAPRSRWVTRSDGRNRARTLPTTQSSTG